MSKAKNIKRLVSEMVEQMSSRPISQRGNILIFASPESWIRYEMEVSHADSDEINNSIQFYEGRIGKKFNEMNIDDLVKVGRGEKMSISHDDFKLFPDGKLGVVYDE